MSKRRTNTRKETPEETRVRLRLAELFRLRARELTRLETETLNWLDGEIKALLNK